MAYSSKSTLLICFLLLSASSEARLVKKGGPTVEFTAVGPGGLRIVGVGHQLDMQDDGTSLDVVVGLGDLNSGIALRDKHMKEKYLEVGKFPNAALHLSRADVKLPGAGDASGTLTMHGVSRPVTFHYESTAAGQDYNVRADFVVDTGAYNIEIPSYLGVSVKREVKVHVAFTSGDMQ